MAVPGEEGLNPTLNCDVCPGCSVTGVTIPVTLKPGPAKLTEFIVIPAVPEFPSVTGKLFDEPTTTLLKPTDDGLALKCADADVVDCPTPVSEIERGPDELVEMFTVPVATPATLGVNARDRGIVWDGFSVTGLVTPENENPVPVIAILSTDKADSPVLVSVTLCFAVPPV